ncbi:monothiol glutaredoxin-S3-like [Helianthus annuus]|uniref:monothiol glutaredoxin-S3-like n=1 Tax=Helianthus annuus TaxID=4232 RepID=UPI000B90318D|nr:monothiol glutaredoxin-S3-like [Helianthus annuus]
MEIVGVEHGSKKMYYSINKILEIVMKVAQRSLTVVIFSKSSCILSHTIKSLFNDLGVNPTIYELDDISRSHDIERALSGLGCSTLPTIFIGGELFLQLVGGANEIMSLQLKSSLKPMLIKVGALWVLDKAILVQLGSDFVQLHSRVIFVCSYGKK